MPLPARRRVTPALPAGMPEGGFAIRADGVNGAPFVAERSIYFGANFAGGDVSSGYPTGLTHWRLASGRTGGGGFDTWLLLYNPSATAAAVTVTYRRTDGVLLATQPVSVPGQRRVAISADAVPGVEGADFWMEVVATNGVGVVAERVIYWPTGGWFGSHLAVGRPW